MKGSISLNRRIPAAGGDKSGFSGSILRSQALSGVRSQKAIEIRRFRCL